MYFSVASGGGNGHVGWYTLPAGSSTLVDATTKLAEYAATVGPDNKFSLFESVKWCAGMSEHIPDENGNLCVPDRSVPEVLKVAPDGSTSRVAIEGFTLDGLDSVTVDTAGNIFVVRSADPNAGVLKYAPTGGAPVVLAAGTFSQVATNG